jgi:two-component SAPR family response regulator
MPGMTGLEFVTRVKAINSEVRVLFMSAFDFNDIEFFKSTCFLYKDRWFYQKAFFCQQNF